MNFVDLLRVRRRCDDEASDVAEPEEQKIAVPSDKIVKRFANVGREVVKVADERQRRRTRWRPAVKEGLRRPAEEIPEENDGKKEESNVENVV